MSSVGGRHRPLESALFGGRIGSVSVTSAEQVGPAIRSMHLQGFDLLIVRTPSSAMEAVRAIETAGGRLCDVLVTLERGIPIGGLAPATRSNSLFLRNGDASDASRLHQLALAAFSGFSGHWHVDRRLPRVGADELYGRWASELAVRPPPGGFLLVVQDYDRELAAFLAAAPDSAGTWSVPLTGVHPRFRGQGLLRQMLIEASSRIAQVAPATLQYETQLTNWPALRTVSSLGFVPVDSRMTFHLWNTDE